MERRGSSFDTEECMLSNTERNMYDYFSYLYVALDKLVRVCKGSRIMRVT